MTTIRNRLTLFLSRIKRKLKEKIPDDSFLGSLLKKKLSYRDSTDIDNQTELKNVNYNSEIFRELVDSEERLVIQKFLNHSGK